MSNTDRAVDKLLNSQRRIAEMAMLCVRPEMAQRLADFLLAETAVQQANANVIRRGPS